jgi:hypothetical protein
MICLFIRPCSLNLSCLILNLLVRVKRIINLYLLVITVVLLVIFVQTVSKLGHRNLGREPGFKEQVEVLSDQVKLISEKLAYLTPNEQKSVLVNKQKTSKKVWVKKEDNMCLVSHTALKILDTCLWYLDSGCSKHMTGDKTLLKEVQMGKGGRITYGDGSQSRVIGKGIIDIPGLGTSQEALYVEGLKANLLSISQFCDNDLVVQFSKKECNIFDSSGR